MVYHFSEPKLDGLFIMKSPLPTENKLFLNNKLIHFLWNNSDEPYHFKVDQVPVELPPKHITTVTFLHKVGLLENQPDITTFSFNKEFYCIHTHDEEVSCNGIIFFGSQDIPLIELDEAHQRKLSLLMQVFEDEFLTEDKIQGEMLQMLLKRLIIICTRLAREQLVTKEVSDAQIEVVRQFNFLVDMHFRELKTVNEYAEKLNRSPKTLSNIFKLYHQKSPLQIIHERTVLEARRLLIYTDKSIKEIAFEMGYAEVSSFHKLFKKMIGKSPQEFREDAKNLD